MTRNRLQTAQSQMVSDLMARRSPHLGNTFSSVKDFRRSRLGVFVRAAAICLGLAAASLTSAVGQQAPVGQPIIMADFNHDGIPDALVLSTTAPTATIAFGSVPYGTFSAASKAVTFPAACTALPQGSVLAGDFNNDGLADIAFFCGREATGVMLGNGDGTFGKPTLISGIVSSIAALGDFNKDGKLDIVAVGSNGTDNAFASIIFFAGNGDGTFLDGMTTAYTSTAVYTAVVIADVNGDGYPDVVAANFTPDNPASIDVFGNNKDGTFGTAGSNASIPNATVTIGASAATSILAGNFYNTGKVDFVVPGTGAQPALFVLQNTSPSDAYTFADPVTIPTVGLVGASAGYFTGSLATDLIVANGTSLSVLANDGTGNLTATYTTLAVPSTSALFAVADANGDGYSDIYTATSNNGALQLAANVTTGSATATSQPFSLSVGTKAVSAAWNGNVNLLAATATGQQIVTGAASATTITSSKNPSVVGDLVSFSASVASTIAGTTPTGNVVFSDGTTQLGTVVLDETGNATYSTATLTQGTHVIVATYAGDGNFSASVSAALSQVVTGLTVASFTPNTANLGDPATKITLTGTGFLSTAVVQVNGTSIATTLVSATTLTAIVPASYFTSAGTLTITVADPTAEIVSSPLILTVNAPNIGATVTAPPTTAPGSQTSITVTLAQPYPVDLVGTLTIGFTRATTPQLTDPSLQFAEGGITIQFPIPANSTTIPPIQLQAGTIAGTITVPLTLTTAGGVNVTPADLPPVTIIVPAAVPSVSSMTVTRSGDQLTVVMHGFSNTREVMSAKFHFTAADGASIGTPDLTLPTDTIFNANWFDTDPSDAYGSTFTYTQIFNTSDGAANIGSVDATLTNSIGASTMITAK